MPLRVVDNIKAQGFLFPGEFSLLLTRILLTTHHKLYHEVTAS